MLEGVWMWKVREVEGDCRAFTLGKVSDAEKGVLLPAGWEMYSGLPGDE